MIRNKKFCTLSAGILLVYAFAATGCDVINHDRDVPGLSKNNKVVIIGDSIFDASGQEEISLQRLAGENYRAYAVSGAQIMDSILGIDPVPLQYNHARNDDPNIRTVIMNGGSNDIGLNSAAGCAVMSSSCRSFINNVVAEIGSLMERMHADGVQTVLYQGYYNMGVPATPNAGLNSAFAYKLDLIQELCDDAPINCHIVDVREAFLGRNSTLVGPDTIHPSAAGSAVLAEEVWKTMEEHNIEQNH